MRISAVVLALLASLAGCTSDGGSKASSLPTPPASASGPKSNAASPSAGLASPVGSPSAATPAITVLPSQFLGGFSTPTGNFKCSLSREFARCSAKDEPWKPLPRSGECNATWETTVELGLTRPAKLRGDCYDLVGSGAPSLPYGRALQVGRIRCVSLKTELQCLVVGTTRGFVANRASYRLTAATSGLATAATPPLDDRPITVAPAGFSVGFVARLDSPDGGPVCDMSDQGVSCIVGDVAWQPPKRHPPCGDSDGDPTTTVEIDKGTGRAFQACRFDSNGGGPELAAGHGFRIGQIECLSGRADLTCTDHGTGHGFVVSRARFRAF